MKTMTCRQLGGPCELGHRGETADEVIKANDRHLREAEKAGDETHREAREAMNGRGRHPMRSVGWYRRREAGLRRAPPDSPAMKSFPFVNNASCCSTSERQEMMKVRVGMYWATTAATVLVLGSGGLVYVLQEDFAVAGVTALGYPRYFVVLLGMWKLLGVLALCAPGFGRLKEWAYAGVMFDLSGAAISHLVVGDPIWHLFLTGGLLAVAFISWALRPAGRRLRPNSRSPRRPVSNVSNDGPAGGGDPHGHGPATAVPAGGALA